MKGRIKMFNADKGFGFITGEDGNDYFAHISNFTVSQDIHVGLQVEFETNENDKGYYATKINVIETKKSAFIAFDDIRIKTSNIKNYGIASEVFYFKKIYDKIPCEKGLAKMLGCVDTVWNGKTEENGIKIEEFRNPNVTYSHNQSYRNYLPLREDYVEKTIEYLYVTTYQNDNYKFYECNVSFDIREKIKEIDDCMLWALRDLCQQ